MSFDSDANDVKSAIDKLNDDAEHLREKVKGGRVLSLLDMDVYVKGPYYDNILGNYIFKVDGPSNKVQMGTSHNVTLGHRGEGILGVSTGHILATDWKKVNGTSTTRITGLKKETVNGAKWDELHGTKFEKKATKTITLGSATECRKTGSRFQKFGKRVQQVLGVKKSAREAMEKVRRFQVVIGKLEAKIEQLEKTVSQMEQHIKNMKAVYDSVKVDASGAMGVDVKGSATYQFDVLLGKGHDGASELMIPYARIAKGGSWVGCAPGHVTVKGAMYHFK